MITLIKDGRKMDFSERAAKIATESLGWSEIIPLVKPKELFTKTKPPEIKLIEPKEMGTPFDEEVFAPELNIIPDLPGTKDLKPDPIQDLAKETEVRNIKVDPELPAVTRNIESKPKRARTKK